MDRVRCTWSTACPFFGEPVGYSPELGELTRQRYCSGEHQSCARYIGRLVLGPDKIPDTLLPGDFAGLEQLIVELAPLDSRSVAL